MKLLRNCKLVKVTGAWLPSAAGTIWEGLDGGVGGEGRVLEKGISA